MVVSYACYWCQFWCCSYLLCKKIMFILIGVAKRPSFRKSKELLVNIG